MARPLVKLTLLRAPRCEECERQASEFARVRRESPRGVEFRDIDIEANPDASHFYRVREHPTTVLEKDGHEVQRWTGVVGAEALLRALEEHVGAPRGVHVHAPGTPMLSGQTTAATGRPGQVAVPPTEELPEPPSPMSPEPPPGTPPPY
jgi:thioredoxin-like negative regulator of GroEL